MGKAALMFLVMLALSAIVISGQGQTDQSAASATITTTTTGRPTVTTTATTTASEMPFYEADSISQITNDISGKWDMWAGQEWHFTLDLQQKDNIITGTMNCLSRYELETYVSGQVSSNGTVEFIRRGPPGYDWTQYYVGKLTATPDHILMNGNYNKGKHLEPANSQWYATVEKSTTITPTTKETSSPPTGTTLVENSKLKWDRNGHYYEIVKKSMDWNDANSYAQYLQFIDPETGLMLKGHLATITSSEENAWIIQTLISPLNLVPINGEWTATWLGGYRDEYAMSGIGGWHWITGEPWGWTNWNQGQPDNYEGKERYLQMWANTGAPVGTWNDNDFTGRRVINYILIEYEPNNPIKEDIDKYNQIKQQVIGPNYKGPIQIQRIYHGAAIYGAGVVNTIQIDSNGNMVKAWEQPITGMEFALYGETGYAIRKSEEPPTAGDEAIVGFKGELGPVKVEATVGAEFSQKGGTNIVGSVGVGAGPVGVSVSTPTEGWVGLGTIGIGAEIAGIIHTGEPIPQDPNSILDKVIFDIIYAMYGPTQPIDPAKMVGTRSDLTQTPIPSVPLR